MMREELLEHGAEKDTPAGSTNRGLSEFKIDFGDVGRLLTSYQLHDQVLTARDPLILPGAFLKWYELRQAGEMIPECLTSEAQSHVMDEIANGEVAVDYGVGFVVLHYASPVTSLIFGGWRENQEFQETRYTRDLAAGTPFERVVASDDTSVWELAPLWQERRSWERYLFSNRHNDSQPNYLRDFLSSAV